MQKKIITISIIILLAWSSFACNNIETEKNNEVNNVNTQNSKEENIEKINLQLINNKQINSNHGGLVYQDGEWIFYSNSSDDYKLYKENINTLKSIKLTDGTTTDIYLDDDLIYFYISSMPYGVHGTLARINKDGTNFEDISSFDASNIRIINNELYFTYAVNEDPDQNQLYKTSLTNKNITKVSDNNVLSYIIDGNWIYYRDTFGSFYRMILDGTETNKISGQNLLDFAIVSDKVLYINTNDDNKIYIMNFDGSDNKMLLDEQAREINMLGDWIYFSNIKDNDKLYKIKIDGSGKAKLSDDKVDSINVIEGWIYYRNNDDQRLIYRIKTDGTERKKVD